MEQRGYVAGEGGGENLQEGELEVDKNCSEKKVKKSPPSQTASDESRHVLQAEQGKV